MLFHTLVDELFFFKKELNDLNYCVLNLGLVYFSYITQKLGVVLSVTLLSCLVRNFDF